MRIWCYAAFAAYVSLLSALCVAQQPGQPHNYALVIGIGGYPNFPEGDRLHYASKDALSFAQTIESNTGVPFRPENVHVLRDQEATLLGIQKEITWLASLPDADTVYVFFSGHGLFDKFGQAYFIPWDGYKATPNISGLRADIFLEDLKHIRATTLVIVIDACHAAAAFNHGGVKGTDDVSSAILRESQTFSDDPSSAEGGTMIWVSSSSNETALEDDQLQAGIFTFYLTKGIRGAAAQQGSSGPVTAPNLFEYVSSQVSLKSDRRQTIVRSAQMYPTFLFASNLQIPGEVKAHIIDGGIKPPAQPQIYGAAHIGSGHQKLSHGSIKIYPDVIYYASNVERDNFAIPLAYIEEVQQNKGLPGITNDFNFHLKLHSGVTYTFQYLSDGLTPQTPSPLIEAIDRAVARVRPSAQDYSVIVTDGACVGCTGKLHISSGKMSFDCKNNPEWSFPPTSFAAISSQKNGNRSDLKLEVPNVSGKKRVYGFTFQGDPHKRPPAGAIEEEIRRAHLQQRAGTDADQTPGSAGTVLLQMNTAIPLQFLQSICSSNATRGAVVPLEVTNDISTNGYVVIPKGTTVKGELSDVNHRGSFKRRGFLRIRLDTVVASSGQVIPVMGSDAVRGGRWSQEENMIMEGLDVIPGYGGVIALGYWMAAPGQDVGIQAGQTMRAFTLEDAPINTSVLAQDSGTRVPELEDRLDRGEELEYRVFHLRSAKKANPGVLKISAAGVSFFSDSEDETAKFSGSEIKSVGEDPSPVPCQMPDLALVPKKGKRYTFLVEKDNQPMAPDEPLEALEWLLNRSTQENP